MIRRAPLGAFQLIPRRIARHLACTAAIVAIILSIPGG